MTLMRFFILFITICIPNSRLLSQDSRIYHFNVHSPEASAIGKYTDMPVSLNTGVPTITIPLYSIQLNEIDIPISLNYHAGGIKVEEVASNVGLGWSLKYGGMINQIKNGMNDFTQNFGWLHTSERVIDNDHLQTYFFDDATSGSHTPEYAFAIRSALNKLDTEADLFNYSLPNSTGAFYFNQNGGYIFRPKNKYKLSFTQNNIDNHANSITIIDDKGIKYIFSEVETTQFIPDGGFPSPHPAFSWYGMTSHAYNFSYSYCLSKIVTLNNDTISYSYEEVNSGFDNNYSEVRYKAISPGYPTPLNEYSRVESIAFSKRVKKIESNRGHKILFNYYTTLRKDLAGTNTALKDVAVYYNTKKIKDYSFEYGYFGNESSSDKNDSRLKLKRIYENETYYEFDYNNETVGGFVNRLSKSQDHWGYYNGASNSTLLPVDIPNGFNTGANREPNTSLSQLGILKQIKYPTGGKTVFEYEPNDVFVESVGVNKIVGGVRIKSIKFYDDFLSSTPVIKKFYSYRRFENKLHSSGMNGHTPRYIYNIQKAMPNSSFPGYTYFYNYRCQVSGTTTPLSIFNGEIIAYDNVREFIDSVGLNGEKKYYYLNYAQPNINYFPFPPFFSTNWDNGLLSKMEVVNSDSSIISKSEFDYHSERRDYDFDVKSIKYSLQDVRQIPIGGSDFFYYEALFAADAYYLFTGDSKKILEKEVSYSRLTDSIIIENEYQFNNPNIPYPTQIISSNSKQNTINVQNYIYPSDFDSTLIVESNSKWVNYLLRNNVLAKPIAITQDIVKNEVSKTISGTIYHYNVNNLNIDSVSIFNSSNELTSILPLTINSTGKLIRNANFFTEFRLKAYDKFGNLTEKQKVRDINEVYLWGYNSMYPVAKIVNSDISTVNSLINQTILDNAIGGADDISIRTHLNTLRSIPNALVFTYTYLPLVGITSETDAAGRTTYYEYDDFNRLKLIRDSEGNIIKKICYNYFGQQENCGLPNTSPNWQNTSTPIRCKKDGSNNNTGEQEQEQRDVNPASSTYNTLRWVVIGTNYIVCPTTVEVCDFWECEAIEGKRCINGVCEDGIKVYHGTRQEGPYWFCDYHYEFSDGSWSVEYTEEVPPGTSCSIFIIK